MPFSLTFEAISIQEASESKPASRIIQPTRQDRTQSRIPTSIQFQARRAFDTGQAPQLAGPWAPTSPILPGQESVIQREARKRAILLEHVWQEAQSRLDSRNNPHAPPASVWYSPDARIARLYQNAKRAAFDWASTLH